MQSSACLPVYRFLEVSSGDNFLGLIWYKFLIINIASFLSLQFLDGDPEGGTRLLQGGMFLS
jgi:hypothetical protein